jgi:hypothetical protein
MLLVYGCGPGGGAKEAVVGELAIGEVVGRFDRAHRRECFRQMLAGHPGDP